MGGLRVLIVDDEPAIRKLVTRILEGKGHQVSVAGGVQEAWTVLQSTTFDVVLCDQSLPDGDGSELAAKIRGGLDKSPPVVMMSGAIHPDDETGTSIAKPFSTQTLLTTLQRAVGNQGTAAS